LSWRFDFARIKFDNLKKYFRYDLVLECHCFENVGYRSHGLDWKERKANSKLLITLEAFAGYIKIRKYSPQILMNFSSFDLLIAK
jgi:hypothetical protein